MATRLEFCEALISADDNCEALSNFARWNQEISITVFASNSRRHEVAHVEEHIRDFSSISSEYDAPSITIQDSNINYIVYLLDEDVIRLMLSGTLPSNIEIFAPIQRYLASPNSCAGSVLIPDGEIEGAYVYLGPSTSDEELRLCLFEELFNSMGLVGDPPGYASLVEHPLNRSTSGDRVIHEYFWNMISLLYSLESVNVSDFQMQ